ncbi:MAG: hypothetical protein EPN93_06425 [Spirochaetes bacterium]|nr:MAG: hypothetical protein EPN93_06425 [Spirochaetota bacterium]
MQREKRPAAAGGKARTKGILFRTLAAAALVVIPLLTLATLMHFLATSSAFYTGIIKRTGFLTAFIESKNWETNRNIQDEIERKVKLRDAATAFERAKEEYAQAKSRYDDLNRTREYEQAKKRRGELSDTSFDDVKDLYATKERFEAFRRDELANLDALVTQIEKHRKEHKKEIKKLEGPMDEAEDRFDDVKSAYEDKQVQARRIAEKHRGSLGAKVFADFELLEPRLTRLLNERLVEGALRGEIEKCIAFLASYETQRAYGRVFESGGGVSIRLPDIALSLRVDDDSLGVRRSRHLLSEVFVDEIGRSNLVQNPALYAAMFRLFDSSLGESLGKSFLGKYGASLQNGVLTMTGAVLEGEAAETARLVMLVLSWGRYLVYTLAGTVLLFLGLLVFSRRERSARRAALARLLVYPSAVIVLAGAALILGAHVYTWFMLPPAGDILLERLASSAARECSLFVGLPVMALFSALFITGLATRGKRKGVRKAALGEVAETRPSDDPESSG